MVYTNWLKKPLKSQIQSIYVWATESQCKPQGERDQKIESDRRARSRPAFSLAEMRRSTSVDSKG